MKRPEKVFHTLANEYFGSSIWQIENKIIIR